MSPLVDLIVGLAVITAPFGLAAGVLWFLDWLEGRNYEPPASV